MRKKPPVKCNLLSDRKEKGLRRGALGAAVAVEAAGEAPGFLFSFSFLKVFSLNVFLAMQDN
jgi:hypothetical protein